jgi:signal transduction histidine kinase
MSPLYNVKRNLFGRSLSARVLWLTVSIILIAEILLLMPSLGRDRQAWLWMHVTQAHLAAFPAAVSASALDLKTEDALLKLSDTTSIRLAEPGRLIVVMRRDRPLPPPDLTVNLANEPLLASIWRAEQSVIGLGPKWLRVIAASPLQNNAMLDITVSGTDLTRHLRDYTTHILVLSLIIALVTGSLVFAVLDQLLVRPMRILTASIVGFRHAPEQNGQDDLIWLAGRGEDEISRAASELKLLQDEMRAALWRNARLAAVGTAVAKISHDLRNILSSALLVADRLQETEDPTIKRAARTLIPAMERAIQLVSRTVNFAREGPPAIIRTSVVLRDLIDETALALRPDETGVTIENNVPGTLVLALDREQIYRVLVNLMRNAMEAGANHVAISAGGVNGMTLLNIGDNGPGLPQRVQENLFKPFTGSGRHGSTGLGLTIARDLVRAHGGELQLAQTGPDGTVFVMELPTEFAV